MVTALTKYEIWALGRKGGYPETAIKTLPANTLGSRCCWCPVWIPVGLARGYTHLSDFQLAAPISISLATRTTLATFQASQKCRELTPTPSHQEQPSASNSMELVYTYSSSFSSRAGHCESAGSTCSQNSPVGLHYRGSQWCPFWKHTLYWLLSFPQFTPLPYWYFLGSLLNKLFSLKFLSWICFRESPNFWEYILTHMQNDIVNLLIHHCFNHERLEITYQKETG